MSDTYGLWSSERILSHNSSSETPSRSLIEAENYLSLGVLKTYGNGKRSYTGKNYDKKGRNVNEKSGRIK